MGRRYKRYHIWHERAEKHRCGTSLWQKSKKRRHCPPPSMPACRWRTAAKDDDGNSLQNQIAVCKDYLEGCPYLRLTEVYSDNGKTGTVFDRPAWNRLMEDVRTGKIQCIVVRDLSRFGRDYVETGNYLEKIFPALGTRFISVKEGFDSFTCGGSMESLSVSLQNLVNAIYSRDISKRFPRRSGRRWKPEPSATATFLTATSGMRIRPPMWWTRKPPPLSGGSFSGSSRACPSTGS